ncbi:TPA: DNA methylase, partial [Klebsiella variicola subsp. variicola]|nr:DNA methylase [Klebsiella variicola subsp. variicola]
MSRFILGNCIDVMRGFPDRAVDLIVTDPPYVVGFKDRQGRQIAGDVTDEWLQPATLEMYRVLKKDALMVSFYGWNRVDRFMAAWKAAGFYAVGQLVFTKNYASNRRNARARRGFVDYCHEGAYVLAKGRPVPPLKPLPDVLPFPYTGNALHPTQKPVEALQPLIESFSA